MRHLDLSTVLALIENDADIVLALDDAAAEVEKCPLIGQLSYDAGNGKP